MDKKWLIKAITFNSLWIIWIALSVLFGYLIAARYYPQNILMLVPFSLIFMVVGGVAAFFAYRAIFKNKPKKTDTSVSTKNAADDKQIAANGNDTPEGEN